MAYLIPLASVSIQINEDGKPLKNNDVQSIFFNVSSWIYICVLLIILISYHIGKLLKKLSYEMNLIYENSMWLESECTERLTVKEFRETGNRIIVMQNRIRQLLDDEKQQKEDLMFQVSAASHDLKTPLTAIRGYVEGILDGVASSPKKTRDYLNTIYNKTNDMTSLIDELLYYSQVAEKHMSYKYEKIYVKEFFDDYAKDLYLELETIKIKFEYKVNVSRHTVIDMDKEQIKRALNNIVSNAVKYMDKEEPEIHFRVTETSDAINIQISDNGRGIDEKDLPHIFERFYRSDVSRNTKLGGSGIGLSIVKKVIENHEGSVVAMSKPGVGTEVGIELKK